MARRPPERYPTRRDQEQMRVALRFAWMFPVLVVFGFVAFLWLLRTTLNALGVI